MTAHDQRVEELFFRIGCGPKTRAALESAIASRAEAPLRALLMTAYDICAEAGAAHQSYDFKARAQSTANQIGAVLAAGKEGA